MKKALADPKVRERLAELGVQGRDMSPQEFTAFVANQVKEWYQPVKDSARSSTDAGPFHPRRRCLARRCGRRDEGRSALQGKQILDGETSAKGLLEEGRILESGAYEAVFHVADWYRRQKVALPAVPFLDVVTFRFGIADPQQHYHLPFKCTPGATPASGGAHRDLPPGLAEPAAALGACHRRHRLDRRLVLLYLAG
jgi:5-hydroxyisourate hydrolase